jgi:hypothetical protein
MQPGVRTILQDGWSPRRLNLPVVQTPRSPLAGVSTHRPSCIPTRPSCLRPLRNRRTLATHAGAVRGLPGQLKGSLRLPRAACARAGCRSARSGFGCSLQCAGAGAGRGTAQRRARAASAQARLTFFVCVSCARCRCPALRRCSSGSAGRAHRQACSKEVAIAINAVLCSPMACKPALYMLVWSNYVSGLNDWQLPHAFLTIMCCTSNFLCLTFCVPAPWRNGTYYD